MPAALTGNKVALVVELAITYWHCMKLLSSELVVVVASLVVVVASLVDMASSDVEAETVM